MSAAYRRRLERDLDRWIAAGYVAPERRADILGSLGGEGPRVSAAVALGVAGAILLGMSVIAFVMANWDALPRLLRLGLVLALLWAGLLGAVWAGERRPRAREGLAAFAALVFPAGLGIVGQLYNLPGEPWQALALAALGGFAIAWAAPAAAPAYVALAFGVWAYFAGVGDASRMSPFDLGLAALIAAGAASAKRFRAAPLLHATALLVIFTASLWIWKLVGFGDVSLDETEVGFASLLACGVAAGAGYAAFRALPRPGALTVLGYAAWWGVAAFGGVAAFAQGPASQGVLLVHNALWIAGGVWLVTFARAHRFAWVTGAGALGATIASLTMLFSLGLDPMAIAAAFCALAVTALVGAYLLARRRAEGGAP